jgi:hypothetical protein
MMDMGVNEGGSGKARLLKFKEPGFSVFRPIMPEGLFSPPLKSRFLRKDEKISESVTYL